MYPPQCSYQVNVFHLLGLIVLVAVQRPETTAAASTMDQVPRNVGEGSVRHQLHESRTLATVSSDLRL
jgi:hypothetical protein